MLNTAETILESAQASFQAGNLTESAHLYQEALRSDPQSERAMYGLGLIYLQAQQLQNAEYLFGEAVRLNPRHADAHSVRGIALARLGRRDEALICFERALSLRPNSVEVLANYGTTLSGLGNNDAALVQLDRALAIDPRHAAAWNNLGTVHRNMNNLDKAVECYSTALEIDAGFRLAQENRDYTLFLLGRLNRCPPALMRQLFDEFSVHYDDTMLRKLTYRGAEILRNLAERVVGFNDRPLRVLDLGCGTGLVAKSFVGFVNGGPIDGIDLSPRMIQAARARGCYRNLTLCDLETELRSPGSQYDLILAADSMVYFGDLSECFSGIFRRLEIGGHFLFTTEAAEGDAWKLTSSHRFAHSAAYIRLEAERCSLQVLAIEACTSRTEHAAPVAGFAVALRK